MPRNPKSQTRPSSGRKLSRKAVKGPQEIRTSKRLFYQCMHCGAMADPKFGLDDSSWCPSCRQVGHVLYAEGALPHPALYGHWLEGQEKSRKTPESVTPHAPSSLSFPSHPSHHGGTTMKHAKRHSGLYCCPDCCLEYELIYEERLQCEECKGPLVKGSLEDYDEGDDDGEEDGMQ
jgi:hypothetical protein